VEERKLSGWRRIAGAMWRPPDDPHVYGVLEFDATPHLELMARARAAGHPMTPTHLAGKAVAHALREVPDFNVRIVGNRVVPRESVDVFFIAAVEGGRELSGVKVERADRESVFEIARELNERAGIMKAGPDPEFARTKRTISSMPRITDKPVAVEGRMEARPVLPLTATIDHRYADGWHIGQLIKPFRAYVDNPAAYEPDPEPAPPIDS
jgi:pyruvate/2-oxoglutarate dehydrogenase complex dihydrolipoamide acyltransferase (E2) component